MTAITFPTRPGTTVCAPNFLSTLQAEWTKIRTLRSTWLTVGGAIAASVGLAALISLAVVSQWDTMSASERQSVDPTSQALIGVLFGAVILGCLAVRVITAEYATGMIRATFSAIPGRNGVLAAKAAVIVAITFPVALLVNFASFFACREILATKHLSMSLGDAGVMQAIVLGALTVSVVSILGLGLGGIMRRTSGAITVLMLAVMGTQIFGFAVPAGLREYLPGNAIQAVVTVSHSPELLGPVAAFAVLVAYAATAMGVASRLVSVRDA